MIEARNDSSKEIEIEIEIAIQHDIIILRSHT